jgi:hypothetical protein
MGKTTPKAVDERHLYSPEAMPFVFERGIKQVFCDWQLVEPGYGMPFWKGYQSRCGTRPWLSPRGIALRAYRPELGPLIAADEPTGQVGGYCTLIKDGGRFRLWHETYGGSNAGDFGAKLCLLESEDCVTWTRPEVGLIQFDGLADNNIVFGYGEAETGGDTGAHGAGVFIDEEGDPSERYKMIFLGPPSEMADGTEAEEAAWLYGATSPDGISWKRLSEPVLKVPSDTQNVGLSNPGGGPQGQGSYSLYLRGWHPRGPGGGGGRRVVMLSHAAKFDSFDEPSIVFSSPARWGASRDIYTNSYLRWPGADRAHLMLSTIYDRDTDTTEVHAVTSRDGAAWDLPADTPLFGGKEEPGCQTTYCGCGLVELKEGCWAMAVHISDKAHNEYVRRSRGLYLATIREDGFVGIEADLVGEFTTFPARIEGTRLTVNAWVRPGGQLRAELLRLGKYGEPIPIEGFSLDECTALTGDCLWSELTWEGGSLEKVGKAPLRVRFELIRARIFAIRPE